MVLPITVKICEYPFKSLFKVPSVKFHSDSMRLARLWQKIPWEFITTNGCGRLPCWLHLSGLFFFLFFFESPFLLILERTWKTNVSATAQRLRVAVSHYPSSLVNKIVDEYFSQIPNCSRPLGWRWNMEKNSATLPLHSLARFPVVTSQCELAIHLPIYCKNK